MICSIGHSNHGIDYFLEMLRPQEIAVLVDARSRPASRWNPHFDRERLGASLTGVGIDYRFEGEALGGLNDISVMSAEFIAAMDRVLSWQEIGPVALMCAERSPADCHRASKLIAWIHRSPDRADVETVHIVPGEVLDARVFESQQRKGWLWPELDDSYN